MWTRHLVMSLMACFLLVSQVWAEEADYNEEFLQNAATADGNGTPMPVDRYTTLALDISIAGTATVNFEGSVLGSAVTAITCTSTADATAVQSVTATGMVQCNIAGFKAVRARISGCAGCTVTVYGRATSAVLGRAGSGSGAAQGLDANFDISGGNKITGTSEAKRVEACDSGGTNCAVMYWHSSGKAVFNCVVANVEGDCNKVVELKTGKLFQITNNGGTVILEVDEATGNVAIRTPKFFPVATCQGSTATLIFDTPTSNAPAPTCEGTNRRMATADFDDTTDESFYDTLTLPPNFKGTIIGHFTWKGANTTNAVGWCMQLVRVPDGATSDPAFPAQAAGNCVSDTAKGTTLQENTATITGVTCTSCVANDRVNIAISRDANGGAVTDSFVGDAKLITYGYTIF